MYDTHLRLGYNRYNLLIVNSSQLTKLYHNEDPAQLHRRISIHAL